MFKTIESSVARLFKTQQCYAYLVENVVLGAQAATNAFFSIENASQKHFLGVLQNNRIKHCLHICSKRSNAIII